MSVRKETMIRPVETIVGANCDNCGTAIRLVFPATSANDLQGQGMLHIIFMGGYGEYIDGRCCFHMCKDCAEKLAETFPKIRVALYELERTRKS